VFEELNNREGKKKKKKIKKKKRKKKKENMKKIKNRMNALIKWYNIFKNWNK